MGIELNNCQTNAAFEADMWYRQANQQVFEISGPAGSGKTFLAKYLIDMFGLRLDQVLCCAYMGKAALQLSLNGLPAVTIHSAIYDYKKVVERNSEGRIIFDERGKPKTKSLFVKKDEINPRYKLILLDEGGMVPEQMAKDLMSFGLPILVLGDLNQLPPIFGNPYFLINPDVELNEVMRQAKGNPIIYLAHKILRGESIDYGFYGTSYVFRKDELNDMLLKKSDIVLASTNDIRYKVNKYYREHLIPDLRLDRLNEGEKIICRKNNWNKSIDDKIYLTNGLSGTVSYVDNTRFDGKSLKIDFRPDNMKKSFKNLTIDFEHLFADSQEVKEEQPDFYSQKNKFEFANALTVHLSQGSQYPNVLFINSKNNYMTKDTYKKLQYTAVTRARENIFIAM